MTFESHTIKIKNLTVYYRIAGNPENPPLVLLNGWGAKVRGFFPNSEKVLKEFARHNFYVISPEHPGLMRSETPKTLWGPKEYEEYLKEFIEKLEIQNFVLVGQSFGGAIATIYAVEHPERIRVLVLVNAGLTRDKAYHFAFKKLRPIRQVAGILRSRFLPKFIKKLAIWMMFGIPWISIEKEDFGTRAVMSEIFRKWSLPNVYSKISTRTILVWGSNDVLFPLSSAKEVAKELPNAELYTLAGGHSVLYTKSRRVIDLIISKL